MRWRRLEKVLVYDEAAAQALSVDEVIRYLLSKLGGVKVERRGTPFGLGAEDKVPEYALRIASSKVIDAKGKPDAGQKPLHAEVEYEKRRILGKTSAFGVLYDGYKLQRVFYELIPREERRFELVHILFTNRLFGTWDENARRYHARVSIYGIPSIISTTGLVEAPAKPREYYILKQQYDMLKKDLLQLKERFQGSYIDHDDARLTEVMKGYAMQAVFFSLIGEPFCEDRGCRLYNSHWQRDVISSQLESTYEFCSKHRELLEHTNDEPADRN